MLLPKYYYSLVLKNVYADHLRKSDLKMRRFVRDLLHLSHHEPSNAFHAPVKYGYGLPCLRWTIPVMALRRLSADRERIFRLIVPDGSRLTSTAKVDTFFRKNTCIAVVIVSDDVIAAPSHLLQLCSWMSLLSHLALTTFLQYVFIIIVSFLNFVQMLS